MDARENSLRRVFLILGIGAWIFLFLSVASFHATDWPAHHVYPYPRIQNLCGSVGAFISYHLFYMVGQGVFPILFFTGVCLAIVIFKNLVSDLWLRIIGMVLLTIGFAAFVHTLKPGSANGFPEGQGGIVGIGIASLLQPHLNIYGTWMVLGLAMLVGLLLTADDLVLRAPGMVAVAAAHVKERTPRINWNFIPELPKLPTLPKFVTRDSAASSSIKPARPAKTLAADDDDEDEPLKPPVMLKRNGSPGKTIAPIAAAPAPTAAPTKRARPNEDAEDIEEVDDAEEEYEEEEETEEVAEADDAEDEASGTEDSADSEEEEEEKAEPVALKKDIVVRLPSHSKPRQTAPPPPKELGDYQLPAWDTLDDAEHGYAESQEAHVREKAAILEQALHEFNVDAHVVAIDTGPVITMYELSLAPGIKVATITGLSNDIARALAATSVRIVAPVPGKNTVGIEVPNAEKEKVRIKELMQLAPEAMQKMHIPLFLGKDASGEALVTDLAAMPHCLIAGTTGSGKSVCINTIIMSIMYLQRPDRVKLILIDPKVVEMAPFKDIPHLMCPVINDTSRATSVLEWACQKMDERYEFLAEAGVRNIAGYNKLTREELIERFSPSSPEEEAKIPKTMNYIVIIIDELADLMMTSGKEVESFIVRLAQKSRAVGIHLILATQRPQANVVTGLIKSNMPSRIAFRVASRMDSRIVLDQNGADLLLGQGDMLFMPPGASKPIRSQGTFIDDREIRDSVKLVKGLAEAQYEPELVQIRASGSLDEEAAKDDLFDDAVRVVLETKRGSVSLLQRRLTIGYSRASRLIEAMAAAGIVGDYKGSQAREAMITLEEWEQMRNNMAQDEEDGMSA